MMVQPGKSAPQLTHFMLLSLLLTGILLAACTSASSGPSGIIGPDTTPLAQLHWCNNKPLMVFHDEGATTQGTTTRATNSTPTTLTNWDIVKTQLNFTVYLPGALPHGSCLISASGTIHDPVFGSSFTIGYLLPTDDSINLSEAPAHRQNPAFQCNSTDTATIASKTVPANPALSATSTANPSIQICSGVQQGTSIVLAARGTTASLQAFYHNLQPDVDWVPGS